MPEIRLESHTIRSHGLQVARLHLHDWLMLLLLGAIELGLNVIEPFHRFVGPDMMTDLKYPYNANTTIPFWVVPMYAVFLPLAIFAVYYFYRRDVYDLHHAILGLLFTVIITGVITDATKDAVGRPRPDFFWRCFPDGKDVYDPKTKNVICKGDKSVVKEGYKSFPSGHTSWSFAGLSFVAWYLAGKIRVFDRRGRIAKLCVIFLPFYAAALVGFSLIDDYWHHWQDVLAGALIGMTVSSLCYLHFFPPPCDTDGWGPYAYFNALAERGRAGEVSNPRGNGLSFRPSETETTYMPSEHGRDRAEANAYDSSSILDQMEAGRRN